MQANGTLLRIFVQRCGAYLALSALLLQFALSFGHIHARDLFGSSTAFSSSDVALAWHRSPVQEVSRQLPSKLADDDELCPICLSTYLLATSFIPDAPQPLLPLRSTDVDRSPAHIFSGPVQSQRRPFQSRAPPLAS